MRSRGSSNRLSNSGGGSAFRSRISALVLAMFATMATVYVAGRMWQEAESRVYLIKELDRRTGQGHSSVSVSETLKIVACKEQLKKLSAIEKDLAAAKQEGFVSKEHLGNDDTRPKKRLLAVIGIITTFGRKKNRDAIRKAWMQSGAALKKLEEEKQIVVRFVIGKSANREDSLDREIRDENSQTNDFIILDELEAPEGRSKKIKFFFAHAVESWDAEFYVKVNDDVYVNIDALGAKLSAHLDKPRVYMGCMKSGEVFSEPNHKWYEPDWWKFGDAKSYFRHASGEIYAISRALAQFISINKPILRVYAHDDVSAGSWFIGLDVTHLNEGKFCCNSWSTGSVCASV
ncbi:putative beta-1,3-galactosyltransferase 11 [Hibiscus syriacus]|uniref:Hexosyltransferase n=1 Tax=Hibiscus syriacus TaxID=106335 RepID=A0A6A3ARB4_HIBSY|nr:hydroxyproline O-galactosyltransferase HPGT1-like [Hibiscus syriacus]KAE8706343.1 putative beta-1,3-galactosyltransferase 11 [Hibiscus syriacus]